MSIVVSDRDSADSGGENQYDPLVRSLGLYGGVYETSNLRDI